jgi:hypothetical protein
VTYLAHGFHVTHLSEQQKPLKLVHPDCREAYAAKHQHHRLTWVNSYHHDAPFDLVSRFALCAHCNEAIRR